ncbi:PA2169 family four-helix-bundle protein [Herminiimonas sp. NPDC097707]|uniref:ferritin-like domain-containing protein n=1 Tax=Herminiimonas sp. NPDC097707 TaxID=3364007 RepID=UPI00383B436C
MKEDLIATLNNLIEVCKDGEEAFKSCAENISDTQLKQSFLLFAADCAKADQELRALVIARGGDPETKSSISGTLHRRWIDIKTAIMGKGDEAVLAECERGEDVAVKSYRRALEKDLPLDVKAVVERQYKGVRQNHDAIKNLRDHARTAT